MIDKYLKETVCNNGTVLLCRCAEAGKILTWAVLYLLNSVGDLCDLNVKYHDG
jgi:hypothetical protein